MISGRSRRRMLKTLLASRPQMRYIFTLPV